MVLALFCFLLCKEKWRSCTMVMLLPKGYLSLYLTFPTKVSNFSLSFSLGSCPSGSATCSSYNPRNATKYIRTSIKPWFLYLNLEIAIVLCSGWKRDKARQCQGSGIEGGSATTWGANLGQGKGHKRF